MRDLVVFGDPVLDYMYDLSDPVRTGGKMLGRFVGAVPGGTTANMACAASKLGLGVTLVGRVAAEEAELHRQALSQAGVHADLTEVAAPRGTHCVIMLNPDGEKTLIFVPIAAPALPDAKVRAAMQDGRFAYTMAADFARIADHVAFGTRICVDVDAAAGLTAADFAGLRDKADVIFLNDVGYQKLTGTAPTEPGLRALMGARAQILCCTGGAGVTHLLTPDGLLSRPALPAKVIDTTGAGDCFNAAFLTRIAEGAPPPEALDFAMAAGALATETLGARASAPSRTAIEARLSA